MIGDVVSVIFPLLFFSFYSGLGPNVTVALLSDRYKPNNG